MVNLTEIPSLLRIGIRLVQYAILLATFTAILAVLGVSVAAMLSVSAIVLVLMGIALCESLADLTERIKVRLDQEGIPWAVPQRDVRVVTHEPLP